MPAYPGQNGGAACSGAAGGGPPVPQSAHHCWWPAAGRPPMLLSSLVQLLALGPVPPASGWATISAASAASMLLPGLRFPASVNKPALIPCVVNDYRCFHCPSYDVTLVVSWPGDITSPGEGRGGGLTVYCSLTAWTSRVLISPRVFLPRYSTVNSFSSDVRV